MPNSLPSLSKRTASLALVIEAPSPPPSLSPVPEHTVRTHSAGEGSQPLPGALGHLALLLGMEFEFHSGREVNAREGKVFRRWFLAL